MNKFTGFFEWLDREHEILVGLVIYVGLMTAACGIMLGVGALITLMWHISHFWTWIGIAAFPIGGIGYGIYWLIKSYLKTLPPTVKVRN